MERVTFTNSRGLTLVGHLYPSDSQSIILLTHGFTGDKSEWGRLDKLAKALNREGYNILTFDFSGSGESDDDSLTVNKWVDDLECAMKYVKEKGLTSIGLFGLSLGALICAKVWDDQIKTMVFWAPVTSGKDVGKRYTSDQLAELDEKGYITYTRDKGVRRRFIVDKQMLQDRVAVNPQDALSHIRCPVLIVHGDQDPRVSITDSKDAMQFLPPSSKLEIVKGADHSFYDQLDIFIEHAVSWFLLCRALK